MESACAGTQQVQRAPSGNGALKCILEDPMKEIAVDVAGLCHTKHPSADSACLEDEESRLRQGCSLFKELR